MDHRNGTRYKVEIPVYAEAYSGAVSTLGCLLNVSLTGGFLLTTLPAQQYSHISLRLIGAEAHRLECKVVWRSFAGLGLEWCEPATDLIRILGLDYESDHCGTPNTASGS